MPCWLFDRTGPLFFFAHTHGTRGNERRKNVETHRAARPHHSWDQPSSDHQHRPGLHGSQQERTVLVPMASATIRECSRQPTAQSGAGGGAWPRRAKRFAASTATQSDDGRGLGRNGREGTRKDALTPTHSPGRPFTSGRVVAVKKEVKSPVSRHGSADTPWRAGPHGCCVSPPVPGPSPPLAGGPATGIGDAAAIEDEAAACGSSTYCRSM